MLDNLLTATHVIDAAHRHGVKKLLYLASSCSYPRLAAQPMKVECLLTGPLEPTNEAYALAKLAGLKLCQAYRYEHGVNFIACIPANAFGPKDDFSPEDSHVIPGLLRKLDEARRKNLPEFPLWGTGQARREFIYVRDLADACVFAMQHYDAAEPLNLGGGQDLSILELAQTIAQVVGYRGTFRLDPSKPDGMPRKGLDSSKLAELGWRPKTDFHTALRETYDWYLSNGEASCPAVNPQERAYRAAV
jgi:GDP-L-fucose synthase